MLSMLVLGQIEFVYPLRLLWLLVLPLLAYFAYRSSVPGPFVRRVASFGCRVALFLLLVIAFTGVRYHGQSDRQCVVFVSDVSQSIGDAASAQAFIGAAIVNQGEHEARFLSFAAEPGEVSDQPATSTDFETSGSDPEAALNKALASVPGDRVPKIVLLSDGLATTGDLGRAAAAAAGVAPVSVVPLEAFSAAEVCLTGLTAPHKVSVFEAVTILVHLAANQVGKAELRLLRAGDEVLTREVDLVQGDNVFPLETELADGDRTVYEVQVTSVADKHPENNRASIEVFAAEPVKILLVDEQLDQIRPVSQTLQQQGFDVTAAGLAALPADAGGLDAFDLVILSDVVATSLSAEQATTLQGYVEQAGGGLLVLGGEATFAEASYRESALETMLPVAATVEVEAQKSSLALALVIDRSSSMEEERRMELAKEAAKQSVRILGEQDKVGIIAFSNEPVWIAEMGPCTDKAGLIRQIDTLEPLGQTHMYRGVERAFLALEQTDADRRYMILLTDGVPSPGDYLEIAQDMAQAGITVSTVSISQGAEQELLKEMARIAGGNHHHCDDPADVPKILVQETRQAVGQDAPTQFTPYTLRKLPGLDVQSAPPLQGYAATSPKLSAEVLLLAARGDPLLCWWRYGEGVTAAFMADGKGRLTRGWQDWPGYGAFWKRLVRHVARKSLPPVMEVDVARRGTKGVVTVQTAAGRGIAQVEVTGPSGTMALNALEAAPDVYVADFPVTDVGRYAVDVTNRTGMIEQNSLYVDYRDELRWKPTDEATLKTVAQLTGGVYAPDPATVFDPDGRTRTTTVPIWRYFAILALLLFVVDVGIRRIRF